LKLKGRGLSGEQEKEMDSSLRSFGRSHFFTGIPATASHLSGEELRERPAPAFVSGTGVNVRTGPSTGF